MVQSKTESRVSFSSSFDMKAPLPGQIIGTRGHEVERTPERSSQPESVSPYLPSSPSVESPKSRQRKRDLVIEWMNNLAHGVREHVKLGSKISETVKGKLSLGSKILQGGGVENVFKQIFSVGEGEKLLKASQCYLSTTAGPIAGLLFVSTLKVAFCSERFLTIPSPDGEAIRTPYKVMIPHGKIKRVNQSKNVNKPTEKYIEIVTVDNFDFWFMGFANYRKAFKYLEQAITQSQMSYTNRY